MRLSFTKMHGLGNDFVLLDRISQEFSLTAAQIRLLADRHLGVGCDQVLLAERPTEAGADFLYRIYNSDGSESGQCGNGARCFARFVRMRGLSQKDRLTLQTRSGRIDVIALSEDHFTVNMGVPCFEPERIPFRASAQKPLYRRLLGQEQVEFGAVSLGNPHAVIRVGRVEDAPVQRIGPILEAHPDFPERVNVGFMEVVARDHIRLRVFERGSGETLACGSGACAALAVGREQGLLGERARVDLPGGQLVISWPGRTEPLWMSGPATHVFEGTVEL